MNSNPESAPSAYVSSAEAAFIAGVSDRDVHRVIDERIVSEVLLQRGDARRVARLATGFIAFYFSTESSLTARVRRVVVGAVIGELLERQNWRDALVLDSALFDTLATHLKDYQPVDAPYLHLDLWTFFEHARGRSVEMDKAVELISCDPEILGGAPVFKGSRVPVDIVLASLEKGVTLARLKESYPVLTEELVNAARVYAQVKPRRGRPRRISDSLPAGWVVKESKVVSPRS